MIAVVGEHDPDVGQRRLDQHAGDVAVGELALEPLEVVDLDHPGGLGDVGAGADAADARAHLAVDKVRDGLVDAAVVAVVVDQDLRAAGDLARDPDHEPVRVGRREGELPVAEAEAPLHLLADGGSVLGRQHRRDPLGEPLVDGGDRGRGRVAGHRPGVTEAEVGVDVAVDVDQLGALGALEEHGEVARPAGHPVHRHARQQRALGPLVGALGPLVGRGEALALAREQLADPVPVDQSPGQSPKPRLTASPCPTAR